MAKKNHKSKGIQHKKPKQMAETPSLSPVEIPIEPEVEPVPTKLELKTLMGAIDTELYDRLLKPAFMSFAFRHDDEPLRQLVESIVTSIAMSDAYDGCRKIDDICQRYLYYLESLEGAPAKSLEAIELNALTDYWRSQVVLTLIRDSAAIFNLLLPETSIALPKTNCILQEDLLHGVDSVLNASLGCHGAATRETAASCDLYDFAHGVSFPWLGFPPESVFALLHPVPDASMCIQHPFALASAEQTKVFKQHVESCLEECLLVDLISAQHKKIYEEICMAFEATERLPADFRQQLAQRIKFDKAYQNAYDSVLQGVPLTKDLHRASRLNFEALNAFGQFASLIRQAAELNLGIYMFHYIG